MTTTTTMMKQPGGSPANGTLKALKEKLRATWMAGNYDYFSRYMEQSAVEFLDRIEVPAGSHLLDVACGSGQLALVAARRGVRVTGVDIASNSIEAARGRAEHEGLEARFDEGDAEELPYGDGRFDAVATLYGAMFAPRPEMVAAELARVTKPGGLIAMGNWNAEGFIGKMFKVISKFIAPPGMPSPVLWGDEETVRARFGDKVSDLRTTRVTYTFDYPFPPAEVVELFRRYYGPTNRGFASLSEGDQEGLSDELVKLWASHNTSASGRTRVPSEYLEVVGRRA